MEMKITFSIVIFCLVLSTMFGPLECAPATQKSEDPKGVQNVEVAAGRGLLKTLANKGQRKGRYFYGGYPAGGFGGASATASASASASSGGMGFGGYPMMGHYPYGR